MKTLFLTHLCSLAALHFLRLLAYSSIHLTALHYFQLQAYRSIHLAALHFLRLQAYSSIHLAALHFLRLLAYSSIHLAALHFLRLLAYNSIHLTALHCFNYWPTTPFTSQSIFVAIQSRPLRLSNSLFIVILLLSTVNILYLKVVVKTIQFILPHSTSVRQSITRTCIFLHSHNVNVLFPPL